jgi:acetoacetate decarboxylase
MTTHDDWTIPIDAPFYPRLPAVYRNVKCQLVLWSAVPEAVARFLPEPLEPWPEGRCAAAGLEVPFSSSYGPFEEAFLLLACRFRNQPGYYCSHVFHNGPAGIAAGREIYGTPKLYARIAVTRSGRAMTTEAALDGVPVMRVTTVTDAEVPAPDLPALVPSWRLKLIPRADGPGPALKQLIDCGGTTRDQVVHFAGRGRGTVWFGATPTADLTPLAPVAQSEAFYFETSYSEHWGQIAYDFLKPSPS